MAGQSAQAQNTYSAYSRFGLGDLRTGNFTSNIAMGGWSLGLTDSLRLNLKNPASAAQLKRATFMMAMNGRLVNSESGNLTQTNSTAGISFIGIGFPVSDWGGLVFGLQPFSSVGYSISDMRDLDSLGNAEFLYEGFGGLNQTHVGFAAKPINNLSLGVQMNHKFGSLNRKTTVDFDSAGFYDSRINNTIRVNDLSFQFGADYKQKVSEKLSLNLSLAYELAANLNAEKERVQYTFDDRTGFENIKDTSFYVNGLEGEMSIPAELSFGFGIHSSDYWGFGADFKTRNWSEYQAFGESDQLANSIGLSVGGYITPNPDAVKGYMNAVTYRAGFHYNETYLNIRNNQLTDVGISFGVSLPIRRSLSQLNLGLVAGSRGTTEAGLIKENYLNLSIGFSLNDKWFVKRTID